MEAVPGREEGAASTPAKEALRNPSAAGSPIPRENPYARARQVKEAVQENLASLQKAVEEIEENGQDAAQKKKEEKQEEVCLTVIVSEWTMFEGRVQNRERCD